MEVTSQLNGNAVQRLQAQTTFQVKRATLPSYSASSRSTAGSVDRAQRTAQRRHKSGGGPAPRGLALRQTSGQGIPNYHPPAPSLDLGSPPFPESGPSPRFLPSPTAPEPPPRVPAPSAPTAAPQPRVSPAANPFSPSSFTGNPVLRLLTGVSSSRRHGRRRHCRRTTPPVGGAAATEPGGREREEPLPRRGAVLPPPLPRNPRWRQRQAPPFPAATAERPHL